MRGEGGLQGAFPHALSGVLRGLQESKLFAAAHPALARCEIKPRAPAPRTVCAPLVPAASASRFDFAVPRPLPRAVLCDAVAMLLCASYAMSAMRLRACYAASGTDTCYAATGSSPGANGRGR